MESNIITGQTVSEKKPRQYRVHKILAHSYAVYFVLFLIGVSLDTIFKLKIFSTTIAVPAGIILLLLASMLILWAQMTSRNINIEHVTKQTFCKGPYCYTRHPTHWGLFLLMVGFGIITNAVFVILFTLIAFLVTRHFFIAEQEKVLEEKYGTPYREYKESVKL